MGFTSFRMGHTHKPKSRKLTPRAATPNPSCATGGFYKAPANGATIDSLKPLNIEWDVTCLDTQKVDIHLLAPWFNGDNTEITVWPNIPFADAKHTVNIKPKWWNSTSSVNVQLTIVPAGTPPGLTTLPAGPVITATYTPPADGSIPASADLTKPDSPGSSPDDDPISGAGTTKSLSGGKTAAAVLLPLLFVALAIFAYLRYQRRKATAKSKRFSEAIDKRMSTISTDWKSMSAAGAHAAIRNSIAVNRDSSAFAFGAIRPLSTASVGAGAGDMQVQQMTQVRTGTGVGLRNPGTAAAIAAERASRVSRVSFADTARPSGESSRRTRAFHSAYVPPLPATRMDVMSTASVYPDSELEKDDKEREKVEREEEEERKMRSPTLSPRQATGPLTLTPEDIRSRIQGRNISNETKKEQDQSAEYDEVMPALSMMRTGLEPTTPSATTTSFTVPTSPLPAYTQTADEYLFTPLPTPPAPTYASSSSPISSPYTQSFASPTYTTPALLSPINTSNSPFSPSAYAYNPAQPSTPISPNPNPNPNPATMSPDDMLRAYAERQALASASPSSPGPRPPPPSAFGNGYNNAPNNTGSPKVKGRKLSLRASFGIKGLKGSGSGGGGGLERTQSQLDKAVIGYPMPAATAGAVPGTPRTPMGGMGMGMGMGAGAGSGMAGVGARGMGAAAGGMAGVGVGAAGANYAIGEDEDDVGGVDYESAYVM